MYVEVRLTEGGIPQVELAELHDMERLSVAVQAGILKETLDLKLRQSRLGFLDGDDALLSVEGLRSMVAERGDAASVSRYEAMIQASSRWLERGGQSVRAHRVAMPPENA